MGSGLLVLGDDWGEPTVRVDQNGVTWVEYKAIANDVRGALLTLPVTISYGSTNGTSWFLRGPEIPVEPDEKTDLDGALDWFLENR